MYEGTKSIRTLEFHTWNKDQSARITKGSVRLSLYIAASAIIVGALTVTKRPMQAFFSLSYVEGAPKHDNKRRQEVISLV